ncbi:MAG: hypothetical protein LC797_22780 [Chloroflexi bacterium]|nr:hypothetical protein [Chloroflexota bacterium]
MQDYTSGLGADNAYGLLDTSVRPKPSYAAFKYYSGLIDSPIRFTATLTGLPARLEGYEFITADNRLVQILWNQVDVSTVAYVPSVAESSTTDVLGAALSVTNNTVSVGADPVFIFFPVPVSGVRALYRLKKDGTHLFTVSAAERDSAVSQYGWSLEGTALCLPLGADPKFAAVYRLNKGNEFLYTASAGERDSAVATYGYVYQGPAFLASMTSGTGLTPVHRLRNSFEHMYMQDPGELASAVSTYGYVDEGIAFYAPSCAGP